MSDIKPVVTKNANEQIKEYAVKLTDGVREIPTWQNIYCVGPVKTLKEAEDILNHQIMINDEILFGEIISISVKDSFDTFVDYVSDMKPVTPSDFLRMNDIDDLRN